MFYVEIVRMTALRIASAVFFLAVGGLGIKLGLSTVRSLASRKFEEETIVNLVENVARGLMWFFVVLISLSILGLGEVAASLGTAAGFVALGVSFALKDVLSDTVAGVYLAKDSDFNNGDSVEVDGVKGTVSNIGLRKSRLELENGNTRVINNSDVEKKWTKLKE
jgi:small-conductance mechanosensitive channel